MQEEFAAETVDFPDENEPTGIPLDINPQYQVFCREEAEQAENEAFIIASKARYNQLLADVKAVKATLRAALKRKYEGRAVDIDLIIKEE